MKIGILDRQEKFEFPDGHRGQKWFLVDESGHEQMAVTAEERDTRDGHYTYKAEGPLAQLHPDMASNQSVVMQWLDGVCLTVSKPLLLSPEFCLSNPLPLLPTTTHTSCQCSIDSRERPMNSRSYCHAQRPAS